MAPKAMSVPQNTKRYRSGSRSSVPLPKAPSNFNRMRTKSMPGSAPTLGPLFPTSLRGPSPFVPGRSNPVAPLLACNPTSATANCSVVSVLVRNYRGYGTRLSYHLD